MPFVDGDIAAQPAAAGRGHEHILDGGAGHTDGFVYRAQAPGASQQLVIQMSGEAVQIDGLFAHGDGGDRHYMVHVGAAVHGGELSEGRLHLPFGGADIALQHDLRLGGHFQITALALDQLQRLSHQRPGHAVLIHAHRHKAQASQIKRRMMAQRNGDGHILAPGLILAVNIVDMAGLGHMDPQFVLAMELMPVDPDVPDPGIRVLRHRGAAGHVGAGVQRVVGQYGQLVQVHVFPLKDDLLHG